MPFHFASRLVPVLLAVGASSVLIPTADSAPRLTAQMKAAQQKAAQLKAAAAARQKKLSQQQKAAQVKAAQKAARLRKQAGSQLPPMQAATGGPVTFFQTNLPYDPRIDLKTDFVTVHQHGAPAERVEEAIRSWKAAGYPVHRMFFIGSDAGRVYTDGRWDGKPHPEVIETDREGQPITVGNRPYVVPTSGWLDYLKEMIRRSIDAGAEGIMPEEPLLHGAGGYSPAFKEAWQGLFQQPWQPPHESPATFWRASRLKSDLYLRAVQELAQYTRDYAAGQGKKVRFMLPVHSPVSYAAWTNIFPHAAAARLPIDGMVAQVWTGPARTPVTLDGRTEPRVFESNWLLYSYFANLMDGQLGKPLYFLADPVEDDPRASWPEYERWYRQGLAASLLFPQPAGYEVMPWPDRVLLPGTRTGGGPAPASYLTVLGNVASALQEMPQAGPTVWTGATRGIGVLTLDTMMWQRGGPQGSSMRSLHGLTLPLLSRGVPVEVVPLERAVEANALARFKVLLLSYDMQKPLGPELHTALAQWVRAGGQLILWGGEDAYNGVEEWWRQAGFPGPTEHLLQELGASVELAGRQVRHGASRYRTVLRAEGPVRDLSNRQVYRLPLSEAASGANTVHLRFTDAFPADGWGPRLGRVRLLDGGKVRADFEAGTAAERPFLVENFHSEARGTHRFVDRDGSWAYRFTRLGPDAVLQLDLGNQFEVALASGADPEMTVTTNTPNLPDLRVPSAYPVVHYPLTGAEPLYRPADGGNVHPLVWSATVGQGGLTYCGLPAAYPADSAAGGAFLRALVAQVSGKARLTYSEAPLQAKRGPYVVAHSLGRVTRLKGVYMDLFHPDLPVLENPQLPLTEPVLYKELQTASRIPVLLHASQRARVLEANAARLRISLSGPEGQTGTARIYPAGMSIAGFDALDPSGGRVAATLHREGRTLRVSYPQRPQGITLTFRWIRPEERLTK